LQLIAVEDAAIPVTIVRTDVLAQERKPLPIVEEFVLRFVDADVGSAEEVAGLLGLRSDLVLQASAIQVSENNLRRSTGDAELGLTRQGLEVVRNLAATQPVLKQLPVVFDRLTWRLADHARSSLITKKDAQDRGLTLVPAARKARIGLDDITAEAFNSLLKTRDGREKRVEILRVRKVSPNTHRYLPVQLLVYGDASRRELGLAVCIEGELATGHGLALDSINAVERLGLSVAEPEPRPRMDEDLESQRVSAEEVEVFVSSNPDDATDIRQEQDLEQLEVRSVSMLEHADLLAQALNDARQRLLIISPWVKSAVVTTDFLNKLERRLRMGVEVTIAYGFGRNDSKSDQPALSSLDNLASRYAAKFRFARLKNSHAKILIFDDHWVNTSFNWLSFRGDAERTYRMEEGTLVKLSNRVDQAYDRYRALVEEQRA
jgi:hypothetical protein